MVGMCKNSKSDKVASFMQKHCQCKYCNGYEHPNAKASGQDKRMDRRANGKALQDVTNGVLGVRRAVLEYQVPRSTLNDCASGDV